MAGSRLQRLEICWLHRSPNLDFATLYSNLGIHPLLGSFANTAPLTPITA